MRPIHTTQGELLAALYEAAAEMTEDTDEQTALVYAAFLDLLRQRRPRTTYALQAA
jgi:hypothetical protein